FGRLVPGVLEDASFDTATPQVGVDRVWAGGRDWHRDVVFLGVPNLFVARHAPLAHGRDDLELGRQGMDGYVEADLVVAFAGAAVGDVGGALFTRAVDQVLGDQRPGERRCQGIDLLVHGAGLQGWEGEVSNKVFARVLDEGFDGARAQGFLAHDLEVTLVADVDGEGDDVEVVLLVDPADRY